MLLGRPRLLAALVMLVFGIIAWNAQTRKELNPLTGNVERIMLDPEQEIALGLQSVPEMMRQFGGEEENPVVRNRVREIGERLLAAKERILRKRGTDDFDYPFRFHVLNDERTINAFALPGGQIFITMALLKRLPNEDAVAGVIGHEIGHVLAWHSNRQMAKNSLLRTVVNSAVVATSDGTASSAQIANLVANVIATRYGREDESESDLIGVQLVLEAGYDPEAMLKVMEVLAESMEGQQRPPEILSTHPFPETRARQIREYIAFFRENGTAAVWPR